MGLIAGINAAARMTGRQAAVVPPSSAHGALISHLVDSESKNFQPSNINFGLFPVPPNAVKVRDKKARRALVVEAALREWEAYIKGS
jgi:methylenetetrahydrofolate--tRNA-(uracil-5-)-methyltransferase